MKIKSLRLNTLSLDKDKLVGTYDIVLENDKILATQSFNGGYGSQEISFSPEVKLALANITSLVGRDISANFGIELETK